MATKTETTKYTMDDVKTAIREILSDEAQWSKSLNWAVNYCLAALNITDERAMRVQVLYILNNIQHWRHPEAKAVRRVLKGFATSK